MTGQMAIAIALLRFNDLGRSVTLTETYFIYNFIFSTLSKMNKKSTWEVKNNSRFLSMEHALETMVISGHYGYFRSRVLNGAADSKAHPREEKSFARSVRTFSFIERERSAVLRSKTRLKHSRK